MPGSKSRATPRTASVIFDQRGFSHSLEMSCKEIDEKQAKCQVNALGKPRFDNTSRRNAAFPKHLWRSPIVTNNRMAYAPGVATGKRREPAMKDGARLHAKVI